MILENISENTIGSQENKPMNHQMTHPELSLKDLMTNSNYATLDIVYKDVAS